MRTQVRVGGLKAAKRLRTERATLLLAKGEGPSTPVASRPLDGFAVVGSDPRNKTDTLSRAQRDICLVSCATLGPAARSAVGAKSAQILWVNTQHAEFILSLSKDFECRFRSHSTRSALSVVPPKIPHTLKAKRFERKERTRSKAEPC